MQSALLVAQGGGGGGGGNWVQIVSILLVVGLSALSWVFQKIAEQAQKKKQLDMAQKRELERLRTGRDGSEPRRAPSERVETSQTTRQRELAARRQAQLEELRRRQQARTGRQQQNTASTSRPVPQTRTGTPGSPGSGRSKPPVVFIPGSSGPIVVTPRRPGQPPQRQQRPATPATARTGQPRRPGTQRPVRPAVTPPPLEEPRDNEAEAGSKSHRLLADTPEASGAGTSPIGSIPPPRQATGLSLSGTEVPRTPAEWRRAIIAREILSPPLALRQDEVDSVL